jgi:hypothetical protein
LKPKQTKPLNNGHSVPHHERLWPAYSFLFEAAAQARQDSQRYWQANDERFPKHSSKGWYQWKPKQ